MAAPSSIEYNNIVTQTKVDLNGDGKRETISIKMINPDTYLSKEDNFVLMVNDELITGSMEVGSPEGFAIIDINKRDNYKESAVYSPGESDDDEFLLYSYDGKTVKKMAGIFEWPTFYGNGIVLVDSGIDFWSKRDKYVLQKSTHTLKWIPQKFYYVGIKGKVSKSFPIYRTKERKYIVANLKPKSEILILACDPSAKNESHIYEEVEDYAYLIKSSTGLTGWIKHKDLWDNGVEGLPYGD